MTEEPREGDEEVQLPDDAVEDLAPDEDDSKDVQGGVYNWWKKVET
jgi:hypothetical protein